CKISPEVRGKTMLLGHWLGSREIADPYRKSDEAFELIDIRNFTLTIIFNLTNDKHPSSITESL
ncbi:hypothetical protein M2985_20480, partial [Klebsiella pneumoniae]|nr:hypothetical protein [Klebsiella pneumoniae]